MDVTEFRKRGKEMVDFVADYLEGIKEFQVYPEIAPGYLSKAAVDEGLLPPAAPEKPDRFEDILKDVQKLIFPGITHWHHPHFFAYYPTANSFPALCADMLSDAIGCIGFTWASSPACTELEVVMMDWLAKLIGLPEIFYSGGKGGGCIQGTASEATLVALLTARKIMLARHKKADPNLTETSLIPKLVCYMSDQSHSSVERASLLGAVRCHKIVTTGTESMSGELLKAAIDEDRRNGLIPFYVVATLGTTSSCAFDDLATVGPVCNAEGLWLHVDAAYAGSAFICPEFRHLGNFESAVHYVDSYNFNPHKWLLVTFDCSAMWYAAILFYKHLICYRFKDASHVVDAFNVDPLYLKHEHQGKIPDYRHWQIPLGRRFRSLKLWFVMRLYGVDGLQAYIRRHVSLAKYFRDLLVKDGRFIVTNKVDLGLVCFRLKDGSNEQNEELNRAINATRKIHIVPSMINQRYFLRFAICAESTSEEDVKFGWEMIKNTTDTMLSN